LSIEEIAPGDERLAAVFEVMRELRTHLSPEDFKRLYQREEPHGYRVAAVFADGEPRAVAGYRIMSNLVSGRHLYVDDLVTSDRWRSQGYGRQLNEYLVQKARDERCHSIQLDSAVHRAEAHRFYFREHYRVASFHFVRMLDE
jgi:GNAT superfamily N-acetyltransferase